MKKYVAPELKIVLLETEEDVLDYEGPTITNPFNSFRGGGFTQYINDLPNGTFLNPDGTIDDSKK